MEVDIGQQSLTDTKFIFKNNEVLAVYSLSLTLMQVHMKDKQTHHYF